MTTSRLLESLAAGPAGVRKACVRTATGFVSVVLAAALVVPASAELRASATPMPGRPVSPVPRELHVHLINEAGLATEALDAAATEAGRIWASAGLRLSWSSPPAPFDVTDGRTVIVIVRQALSRVPAPEAADSQQCSNPPLGWLVFGRDEQPGNLIEVSLQALISIVTRGSQLDRRFPDLPEVAQMSVLGRGLGRVVAHEIGHWVKGRGHTKDGLMKASFDVRDLLDVNAARLPRAWTAAGAGLRGARSLRAEPGAPILATRDVAPLHARLERCGRAGR